MHSLANTITDFSIAEEPNNAGERYFVAATPRGPCVINYTPAERDYVGGPFLTWDGAYAYIDIHIRRKRGRRILTTALICASVAVVALMLTLA